jgi:hypothetical protein
VRERTCSDSLESLGAATVVALRRVAARRSRADDEPVAMPQGCDRFRSMQSSLLRQGAMDRGSRVCSFEIGAELEIHILSVVEILVNEVHVDEFRMRENL